ncbi:MAG: hypothetical protein PHH28_13125 [Desulfuromonadaceae bacterium]|nr:hypothetical protein [Desulfuromonadaceae bacterium]
MRKINFRAEHGGVFLAVAGKSFVASFTECFTRAGLLVDNHKVISNHNDTPDLKCIGGNTT